MKRGILWCATLAVALAAPAAAHAETYFGFQIGVSNAPPPPRVVVYDEPEVAYVTQSRVYVVEDRQVDYDVFRYGGHYYACNDGYWYRARSYRGPYRVVDVRQVPRAIFYVPAGHWKHRQWSPRSRDSYVQVVKVKERHGHKHKHKHGHDDDDD